MRSRKSFQMQRCVNMIKDIRQQILMLNYCKVRESAEKIGIKRSLPKTINKSHTSSINMKASNEPMYFENGKIPLKNLFKEKCEMNGERNKPLNISKYINNSQRQKYAIKLQNNEHKDKENATKRKDAFDRSAMKENIEEDYKPFAECNRYLETERYAKEPLKSSERLTNRQNGIKLKTEYVESSCDKYKREVSTKQTNTSSNQIVRVSASELRAAIQDYHFKQKQINLLQKQLEFYRKQFHKVSKNSVVSALKI